MAGKAIPIASALDLASGERPQAVVPARAWQSAKTLGDWTLVSCVVAPGFEFSAFEMAAPDWRPAHAGRIGKTTSLTVSFVARVETPLLVRTGEIAFRSLTYS